MVLRIRINPRVIMIFMVVTMLFMILMGSVVAALQTFTHLESAMGFIPLFNLDAEGTAPAFFSSFNLGFASLLLLLIAQDRKYHGDAYWRHWYGLAAGFLFMCIDESISLHEKIVHLVESTLVSQSYVINYGIAAFGLLVSLGLFITYFKFLLHLPWRSKRNFVLSGIVFISGAFVTEAIGGYIYHHATQATMGYYYATAVVEESLEMIGVVLFIKSLFLYIDRNITLVSPSLILQRPQAQRQPQTA